ncbi:duboraya, partial [Scophthalmus maximus]|uniref:duboraya n=1 Tax=Scophthalmus maximus TaxID=52904 RepID=UPI0015E0E4FA
SPAEQELTCIIIKEEAPSRRSVAELAGRFRGSTCPHVAAGNETEKPVRRRPPRSLQLPKTNGDDQEPPGVTSPLPAQTKRNSALIEKLQASLALSPSPQLPSPKSPGFRLLLPAFPLPSPGLTPETTVTTSSTPTPTSPIAASPIAEEEGPASFEAPPSAEEGSILPSINKSRARHSIRRRPPSRRNRNSSSGDEVGVANDVADKSRGGGEEREEGGREEREEGGGGEMEEGGKGGGGGREEGGGGEERKEGGEVFKIEGKTDASTCPGKNQTHKEDQSKTKEDDEEEEEEEGKNRSVGGRGEGDRSSSGREEEEEAQEKSSRETHKEDGGGTKRDGEEEE